jgi:MoxR-like ATPase
MTTAELNEEAKAKAKLLGYVLREVHKVIVGQERVLRRLLLSLLSDGHVLLEGLPGLAKTLMIRTLAKTLRCDFARVQFTPDLLPADLIGTKIYNQATAEFETKLGPIFTNILLADEINRAPPKVQSALLEAMQERSVTIGGESYSLPKPFLVLATQNPIEQEGTYPLPEAQVDRFMFKVHVGYPSEEEELEIIDRHTSGGDIEVEAILSPEDILQLQSYVRKVYIAEEIKEYIVRIAFATRNPSRFGLDELSPYIQYGASPRASIFLALAAKANALLEGRSYVIPDDIKAIAEDVLNHRLILTYEAEAEEVSPGEIIEKILSAVEVP